MKTRKSIAVVALTSALTLIAGTAIGAEPVAPSDAPPAPAATGPWTPDLADGTFKNPVLFADYSDPDVVRVGDDFYLTSSSFNCVPGLPILHSRDLVNWQLVGHAVDRLPPRFDDVLPGQGLWAPSFRYHDGTYWIFVGDPDWGILMTRADSPAGPWEPLHVVKAGLGLIDPCPLWDDDGRAYLVHAFAKSRAGKNSILVVQEMAPDGSRTIGEERLVIDGRNDVHPTIEGPKFYKRNGWYYILAPAGGVKEGWQLAARSKNVFGPYEVKRVLEQGSTRINGPHQGGWVELASGEHWFVHFQDRGAYGRVVQLTPMRWEDDWPVMGVDHDGNGVGEPVATAPLPAVNVKSPSTAPQTSDTFDPGKLGLQWQWQTNPRDEWASLEVRPGWLRLFGVAAPKGGLIAAPNQLLQKLPAPKFMATTAMEFAADSDDDRAGLVVTGQTCFALLVSSNGERQRLTQRIGAENGQEQVVETVDVPAGRLLLRTTIEPGARCSFSYSTDGEAFTAIGEAQPALPGKWTGAKVGLICQGEGARADFDEFVVE
jgi:beta-xylosidase